MLTLIDKAIYGLEITDADIAAELYEICDRVHSGCNDDCPVYASRDRTNDIYVCSVFKDGLAMLKLLRERAALFACPDRPAG